MPLLARMVPAPMTIDIRAGAVDKLAPLLADRRISRGGHVAIAVGPGLGEEIAASLRSQLVNAEFVTVRGGTLEAASALAKHLRLGFYDALVGIGGGRTIDVAKSAASMTGLPMVAVATNLAHDGIASPVSSLESGGRKASFGVNPPIAVVVDLDYVRRSPPAMRSSGFGDVVSNLSAIADWHLAERACGEIVDGVAETFARTAAAGVLHRADSIDSDDFLVALADALVLSGLAMATAGSSRPCSGAEHEIVHAIDHLFPGAGNHGELVAVATLFACHLRGDGELTTEVDAALRRHALPRLPADVGLTEDQFVQAVVAAPATRPDRYTILEQLDLDAPATRRRVGEYLLAVR